jgi:hypothetical protein
VISTLEHSEEVQLRLRALPVVKDVLVAKVGGPAHLV